MKVDYENYIAETEINLQESPSDFWKFVKSKRTNGSFALDSVRLGNKTAENSLESANLFAEYFGSTYLTSNEVSSTSSPSKDFLPPDVNCHKLTISMSKIHEVLSQLNVKKAAGPDGLPPCLF